MAGIRNPVGAVGGASEDHRPSTVSTLDHLEGQQIGRYLIGQRLGGGGVATVYQAYDQVLGQTVALKVLPPNPDDATLHRFRREALMAGALRHPHIVRIFQVGTSARGGAAYLAMELVEGESLAGLLSRQGSLLPAESCNLLEPIARALAFAHDQGIVHRDVKPGNILLRPASPGTPYSVQLEALDHPVTPLLSDFGVARFLDAPELTSTGRTVGTPAFMAPEQCMGSREIDGRADIYALGTVLFRCVTGRLPFSGSMTQVLHAQVYEPVVIEEHLLAQLGPVSAILQRSLAKEPDARYPDAGALADDLAQAAQRSGGGQAKTPDSALATATLTLSTLETLPAPGSAAPMTVLVPGTGDASAPTLPSVGAGRRGGRTAQPWLRWIGVMTALLLAAALGTLGMWATAWRENPARATPTAQLAVLAPAPTATGAAAIVTPGGNSSGEGETPQAAALVGVGITRTSEAEGMQPEATPTQAPPTPTPVETSTPMPTATAVPSPDLPPTEAPTAVETLPADVPPAAPPITVTQEAPIAGVCANVVDEFFLRTMDQVDPALREEFRCPTAPAYTAAGALMTFDQGFMLALDESPYVYVYYQATREWEQVVRRDGPAAPPGGESSDLSPPFAQVWSENQRRIALGNPTTAMPTPVDGVVQVFSGGMLVGDRSRGTIYAFPLNSLRL